MPTTWRLPNLERKKSMHLNPEWYYPYKESVCWPDGPAEREFLIGYADRCRITASTHELHRTDAIKKIRTFFKKHGLKLPPVKRSYR